MMRLTGWRIRGVAAAVLAVALLATTILGATAVFAHPLGNFTINRYARLELFNDAIQIHYVVDMAEIPTFQALDGIDTDGDGSTSEAELAAFGEREAAQFSQQFTLAYDGKAQQVTPVETSVQRLPGQGGLDILRTVVVYSAPAPADGKNAAITFEDRNYGDRVGWKEIVIRPSSGSTATIPQDLLVEQSNALLEYPAETLSSAPDMRSATFTFEGGSGEAAPANASVQQAEGGRLSSGFASLIGKDTSSAWVLLFSLGAAFGFGAHRPHRGGGAQYVLALEQSVDRGFADRQRPDYQGTMRHGFIAGHGHRAAQGTCGRGGQSVIVRAAVKAGGRGSCVIHHGRSQAAFAAKRRGSDAHLARDREAASRFRRVYGERASRQTV